MIEPFQGIEPRINPTAWVHPSAVIIGRVRLGRGVSVWPGVVLRGDILEIEVGDDSNIQDLSVAHTSHGVAPVKIGKRVVVGHRVILHGTAVGDDALIGMGAILLDGSEVGAGSIVAAGALVPEGMKIPPGHLALGIPAKVARPVRPEETARIREGAKIYLELMAAHQKPHGV
ncbi:MAG: gamma carbonic anhydrase family protein [Candidatus Omnitrophica bacterium]|nr:gamma carbonic anhydrase family protein [Candidatus Omnitrophota bacterium]